MLTSDEKKILVETVNQTWDQIASDWAEMGGGSSLFEKLEACLDADRWRMTQTKPEVFEPILKKVVDLKWGSKEWKKEMKEVFK